MITVVFTGVGANCWSRWSCRWQHLNIVLGRLTHDPGTLAPASAIPAGDLPVEADGVRSFRRRFLPAILHRNRLSDRASAARLP